MKDKMPVVLAVVVVALVVVAIINRPVPVMAQLPPGGGGPCESLINDVIEEEGILVGYPPGEFIEVSCETEEVGGNRLLCATASGWNMDYERVAGKECVDLGPIDP